MPRTWQVYHKLCQVGHRPQPQQVGKSQYKIRLIPHAPWMPAEASELTLACTMSTAYNVIT